MERGSPMQMPAPPRSDVRALTGLRGIAALLVATYHFLLPKLPVGSLSYKLLGRGYLYVDLFFILSGYVIALNYGANFAHGVRLQAFGSFLWRRLARVYPVYLAVLASVMLGHWLVHHDFSSHPGWWIKVRLSHPWLDIPANIVLIQSWWYGDGIVGQAWSVSAEFAAYLVFPWLAHGLLGDHRVLGKRNATLVLTTALVSVAALLISAQRLGSGDGLYHAGAFDIWAGPPAIMRCLGGFTLGLCLYRLSTSRFSRVSESDWFGLSAVSLWLFMLASSAPDLLLYLAFGALVLCLGNNRGRLGALVGSPPVYAMGLISYSFYLIHVYFVSPMDALTHVLATVMPANYAEIAAAAVTAVGLLACSGLAYVAIEKPARKALRRPPRTATAQASVFANPLRPSNLRPAADVLIAQHTTATVVPSLEKHWRRMGRIG